MRGFVAIALSSLIGCSSSGGGDVSLQVLTPERGTTAGTHDITVTGTVTGDPRVTVNGVEAQVSGGAFTAHLTVDDGITLIETHAISGDQDLRDVRAVLAGDLAPSDGTTAGTIGARIGTAGFTKVGTVLAQTAQGLDWNALAQSMNPVYDSSGCNSAKINITELTVGKIGVGLTPKTDAIGAAVTIDDVYVKLHVDFKAVCIGGSTTVQVRSTRAHIDGDLAVDVIGGKLSTTMPSSAVTLDGFSIDIGGVPGALESLVRGKVRDAAENALDKAIKQQVPPKANEALGGLLAQPIQTAILSKATTFTITPADVSISADGMIAAVDAKVLVAGGEGGMFVSSPGTIDGMQWQGGDLGVALDDDLLNQLFSGLWASGAIAPNLSLDGPAGILGAVLDPDARSIALEMKLPPVVKAQNGNLDLALGDAMMHVKNDAGTEIQTFALNVETSLAAAPTATGVNVTLGAPIIKAQVVMQSDAEPTQADQLEGIVNGAWGLVGGMIGDAMANLPMPSVAGMQLGEPAIAGQAGFVVVDVPLQ